MSVERVEYFKRNEDLEDLLEELYNLLNPLELKEISGLKRLEFPVILIHGVARSGTTLLMQWMADSGYFSYPTNFLSRFYGSPFIGAKLQKLIFDIKYNFNNELYDFSNKSDFTSNLGKTTGPLAPNEFWYFWRRFFSFGDIQVLSEDQEKKTDIETFISELAAMEMVFNKPFAMKGMIVNWNIPFISKISDKILFIHLKRDPIHNIRSLLSARKNYSGSEKSWYSFKPPEYEKLKDLSPIEQVAGQVYFTNKLISEGLLKINKSRWIEVGYEDFCKDPGRIFYRIKEMFSAENHKKCINDWHYNGPLNFNSRNISELTEKKYIIFQTAYEKFKKGCFQ